MFDFSRRIVSYEFVKIRVREVDILPLLPWMECIETEVLFILYTIY